MDDKGGLVDRIMKSAEDLGRDGDQKVHRKKITLDDLNKVIVDYVHKTAGMGNPELRSRIVQLELQIGTMRDQAGALQRALDSARAGWKAAQDQALAAARERAGLPGATGPELALARKEASEAREEGARQKGRLEALEAQAKDWADKHSALQIKAEKFAARLDEALRNEKKLRSDVLEAQKREEILKGEHGREVDALQAQIEALSSGYDHVELVGSLDLDGTIERAKAAGSLASRLSVDVKAGARKALERVEARAKSIRLSLEALRDEAADKLKMVEAWEADYPTVQRIAEIHRRFVDADAEIADLEGIASSFAPEDSDA